MEQHEHKEEANRIFGRRWHSIATLIHKQPDSADARACYWCDAPHSTHAAFNVWGTVTFVPCCEEHRAEYHGWCGDSIPAGRERIA